MAATGRRWHDLHSGDGPGSKQIRVNRAARRGKGRKAMRPLRFTEQFKTLCNLALQLTKSAGADAILLLLEGSADWQRLKKMVGDERLLVAADTEEQTAGADAAGLTCVKLGMRDSPVYERLTQSVLEAVADDILAPGSCVVALY